jgi:phenylpropionate dioxygenase-like ring-hydroxylating dioxygenase large terminal subunit
MMSQVISPEENNLLRQTKSSTPCGELMRRYWQPAALSEELGTEKPLAVQLFNEELILFRDAGGKPALIGRYCAHQGVDMIYGRIEPDGIRCMYHGWLFDNCGKVVLRGDWLAEKERRWDVGQPAYPCAELGGVIFAFMGPGDPPALPAGQFLADPAAEPASTKLLRDENYLDGIRASESSAPADARFVMPNVIATRGSPSATENSLRWHVPVDDNSHVEFTIRYVGEFPFLNEPQVSSPLGLLEALKKVSGERQLAPDSSETI